MSLSPTRRSTPTRLRERARTDRADLYAVLDEGLVCHVGVVRDGAPVVLPTGYGRIDDTVYVHGSTGAGWLRIADGAPVCLTVTHLDSLVLARCGFNHSADYRSVMVFGRARLLEDQAEKERALVMMVDRLYPGRTAHLRQSSGQEIKATAVIYMDIEKASAKVRAKGVVDEDEDYQLPIYAERLPIFTVIGTPEPCPQLKEGVSRPDNLTPYREGRRLEEAATEAYAVAYPAGRI